MAPTMRKHSCSSGALDRARFHHRGHAVDPVDALFLEHADHVDVDEVDAELLPGDAIVLHRLDDGVGELVDLLSRGRTGRAFDPGERVTHVLLRNPRRMALDLEAEVALLEQNWPAVAAQHGVAQAGLEPVPARRQRAGDVAHVLVVHAEHGAEAVLLHHRARALDAVFAQPLPVDALLPIETDGAEIRCAHGVPPTGASDRAVSVLIGRKLKPVGMPRRNNIFCVWGLDFLIVAIYA